MKISVIFTGGTIASRRDGEYIDIDRHSHSTLLEAYRKQYKNDAEFSVLEPFDILSENQTNEYIFKIASLLRESKLESYDGVIITHGTDTLQYTAAFLGYLFHDSKVPIVLVSSNKPLENKSANGLCNFAGAIKFIESSRQGGVYVSYQNENEKCKIHSGVRLLSHPLYSDRLTSINDEYIASVSGNNVIYNEKYSEKTDEFTLPDIELSKKPPSILRINAYVGMGECLSKIDFSVIDCVILSTYHSGTLATGDKDFVRLCKQLKSRNIPVFICGEYMKIGYATTASFQSLGLISLACTSPIAMQAKFTLLYMCGRTNEMQKRLAGDM